MSDTDYIGIQELADFLGIKPEEVPQAIRRLCPHAVEFQGLDREPVWTRADLEELLENKKTRNAGKRPGQIQYELSNEQHNKAS